jgi:hypothetical protein
MNSKKKDFQKKRKKKDYLSIPVETAVFLIASWSVSRVAYLTSPYHGTQHPTELRLWETSTRFYLEADESGGIGMVAYAL